MSGLICKRCGKPLDLVEVTTMDMYGGCVETWQCEPCDRRVKFGRMP